MNKRPTIKEILLAWLTFGLITSPILVWGITSNPESYKKSLGELLNFVSGNISAVNKTGLSISSLSVIFLLTLTGLFLFGLLDDLFALSFGKTEKTVELEEILAKPLIAQFWVTGFAGIFEELLFRGGFLWLLPLVFKGPRNYYFLFLLSTVLFAFMHLFNYKGFKGVLGRTPKTICFLIPGVFLGFIFYKFGFIAACMGHVLYNIVVTSSLRLRKLYIV